MRNIAKIFLAMLFALTVGNSASAIVSVTLTQIGGTYSPSTGGTLGSDSLVLRIDYAITGGQLVSSIDVAISVANLATLSPGSSETGPAVWEFGFAAAEPVGEPGADIASVAPGVIGGWEKQSTDAWGTDGSCIFDIQPGGSCGTLGVVSLHLTGVGGYIFTDVQGHTVVMDGQGNDITASARLGSFMLFPAPEPNTASLFGLGLVGLAAVKRRRS
jgi:hypothetical protein